MVVQYCHRNQGACIGLEMSLMLSRDQTMQGDST